MGDEKFASLSSGLLARKGAAKPAMRRQGYMNPQGDVSDDLGWNDMGYEPPRPIGNNGNGSAASVPSAVHKHLDQLAEDFGPQHEEADVGQADEPAADDAEDVRSSSSHLGLSAMEEGASAPEPVEDSSEAEESPVEDTRPEAAEVAADAVIKPQLPPQVAEVIPMRPSDADSTESNVPAREKVAFTLRLDKQRHLKLRLASAIENQSAQRLVTEALDEFFKHMPDLDRLAANSRDRN